MRSRPVRSRPTFIRRDDSSASSRRYRWPAPGRSTRSPRRPSFCSRTSRATRPARSCAWPAGGEPGADAPGGSTLRPHGRFLWSPRRRTKLSEAVGTIGGIRANLQEIVMVAAVRVHKHGGPEVLTYEDIELPAPGQGQIRLKQHASGVNFIDTYFRGGLYPSP